MKWPKISVVTPTFNSIHTVRDTIESVRTQDYENREHLIIDGGSTDGTLDILKEYPHLTWVSEKDEGHWHAMNKGIERASGDVVNILNSDDCFRASALRYVAEGFRANPGWDALFGDVVYVDGKGDEIFRREEARFDYDVLRYIGTCYVLHQTFFVKRELHNRFGLYRHKEFKSCCDYDFILRMGQAKCRIGHIQQLLVNYRFHEHGQSADLRVVRNMAQEAAIIQRAHGVPGGLLGKVLRQYARGKRQLQKFRYRGSVDLVPGTWLLRKHVKEKAAFSSNTDFGNKLGTN